MDTSHVFKYHAPTTEQLPKYEAIREAAKALADVIIANTPPCADQSAALRHVREAMMTANASIALRGVLDTRHLTEGSGSSAGGRAQP